MRRSTAAWRSDARAALEEKSLELWVAAQPQAALDAPPWIRQLVLAAAQFRVARPVAGEPDALTILAGYHWFGEWSRDTMIALPGLALGTGRADLARSILHSLARFVDQGMLPNDFPESGRSPEYNSVDAALWYFEALRQYHAETSDLKLIEELFPILTAIVDWHVHGTRNGIRMDEADGLLHAGEPGVQLTWMDAKVGDRVITPRIGKPVEVNALWYNALRTMARFAFALNKPPDDYVGLGRARREGLRAILERAGARLLRRDRRARRERCVSAAQSDFRGVLAGKPAERRAADGRGGFLRAAPGHAAWPANPRPCRPALLRPLRWPARRARRRVSSRNRLGLAAGTVRAGASARVSRCRARVHVPRADRASPAGVTASARVGEIFDGDPPHAPRGAIAQAWSVGEILRAWRACQEAGLAVTPSSPGGAPPLRF